MGRQQQGSCLANDERREYRLSDANASVLIKTEMRKGCPALASIAAYEGWPGLAPSDNLPAVPAWPDVLPLLSDSNPSLEF